jgi:subtilisin family serine protease
MRSKIFKTIGIVSLLSILISLTPASTQDYPYKYKKPLYKPPKATGENLERISFSQKNEITGYVPGEILVKFKEGLNPEEVLKTFDFAAEKMQKICSIDPAVYNFRKTYKLERDSDGWYPFLGKNYKEVKDIPDEEIFKVAYEKMSAEEKGLYRIYKIRLPKNLNVNAALAELKNNPHIEIAEPNYISQALWRPNDPRYAEQWAYNNTAAEAGWDITRGNANVVIAVIDTGVDYNHEDLAANIWRDSQNHPGVDFVDTTDADIPSGWEKISTEDYSQPDYDPRDLFGHGTFIAGISAAVANNALGVAGLANQCQIMAVRVGFTIRKPAEQAGYYYYTAISKLDNIITAINWVSNQPKVKVINMSFGGGYYSALEETAVNAAYNKGITLVAAAGNGDMIGGGSDVPIYPAAYENVIAVAATTPDDQKADYSSFGTWVDVAAPGGQYNPSHPPHYDLILSTVPPYSVLAYGDSRKYTLNDGTSLASPFVAGLAGLIIAHEPNLNPAQVKQRILAAADPMNDLYYQQGLLGSGRVNCARALYTPPAEPVIKAYAFMPQIGVGPSETNVAIILENLGEDAAAVGAVLSSVDPLVTINKSTANFGNILKGQRKENSNDPFKITVSNNFPLNHEITFTVSITANNGSYTTTQTLTMPAYRFKTNWPVSAKSEHATNLSGFNSVMIDDLDGDNKLEVVAPLFKFDTGEIYIYRWLKNGTPLGEPLKIKDGCLNFISYQTVSLGDVYGDDTGKEIVLATAQEVYVVANNQLKSIAELTGTPATLRPCDSEAAVLADLNANGKLDIIACSNSSGGRTAKLEVWDLKNPYPANVWPKNLPQSYAQSITVADLDLLSDSANKKHPEIVAAVVNLERATPVLYISAYDYQGKQLWKYEQPSTNSYFRNCSLSSGDLNNDGYPEIVCRTANLAEEGENSSIIILNKAGALLKEITTNKLAFGKLPLADINEDGTMEIIALTDLNELNAIYAYKLDGARIDLVGQCERLFGVNIADIDGDKHLEIIGNNADKIYVWNKEGDALSDYDVAFGSGLSSPAGALTTINDTDKDGKVEILAATDNKVYALAALGSYDAKYMPWPMQNANLEQTGYAAKTIFGNIPNAPANLAASEITQTSLRLNWQDNSHNEDGFKIERSADNVTFSQIATVNADIVTYHNSGLSGGTTYYYRVRAYNNAGNSDYSNVAEVTTASQSTPTAPSNLVASEITQSQTRLSWADNSDNESGFKIQRLNNNAWSDLDRVGANVTTYLVSGLNAGVTYKFRVRAYNANGDSAASNEVTVLTNNNSLQVGPVTPNSGSSRAQTKLAFDVVYTDPQGADNITFASFNVDHNTNTYDGMSFNVYYNKLYVVNNSHDGWLGGFAPGANHNIENNDYILHCKETTVLLDGNKMTVHWVVTPKASYTGDKVLFAKARNEQYVSTGWVALGTWTLTNPNQPQLGPVTPSSGSSRVNTPVVFEAVYSDPNGLSDLAYVYFNKGTNTNTLYAGMRCDLAKNEVRLANNQGTDWGRGYPLGSNHILENNYFRVDCSKIKKTISGEQLIMTWEFTPKRGGDFNLYSKAQDKARIYTPWTKKGTWTVIGVIPLAPSHLNALRDSNAPTSSIKINWKDNSDNEQGFKIQRKVNDGAFKELTTVKANVTSHTDSGLSAGTTYTYKVAAYNNGGTSAFSNEASAKTNSIPTTGAIIPASGSAYVDQVITFTAAYLDADGASNIKEADLLIKKGAAPAPKEKLGCKYSVAENKLYLWNGGWGAGFLPGSNQVLENAHFKLYCKDTNVTASGNTLTIKWTVSAKETLIGANTTYLRVIDKAGEDSSWQAKGTIEIKVKQPPLAPSNLKAQIGTNGAVNLNWTDNADNEKGFKIERKTTADYTQIAQLDIVNATTYSDTAIKEGTTYTYRVRAFNAEGNSNYSNTVSIKTNTAPVIVSLTPNSGNFNTGTGYNFSAVYADADGYADLSGLYFSVGQRPNAVYVYYNRAQNKLYIQDSSGWSGGFAPGAVNIIEGPYGYLNCAQTSVSASGNNCTVNWAVSFKPVFTGTKELNLFAYDNKEVGSGWQKKGTITISSPNIPTAPSQLTAAPDSSAPSSRIRVNWKDNSNDETKFTVQISRNGGTTFEDKGSVAANTTTYIASDYPTSPIKPGTTYHFRVYALRGTDKSNYSNTASATTASLPNAPSELTAEAISSTALRLKWKDNSNNEQGFKIQRKVNNGAFSELTKVNANVTTYTDSGLSAGTTYTYKVAAYNNGGTSAFSNEASAKTNSIPSAGTITPVSGSARVGEKVTFTATYIDNDGAPDIEKAYLLIKNGAAPEAKEKLGCKYSVAENKLYLWNDGWGAGFLPGSNQVLENANLKFYCQDTTVTASGNTLTIKWRVSAKKPLIGNDTTYLRVIDKAGKDSSWQAKGTIEIKPR